MNKHSNEYQDYIEKINVSKPGQVIAAKIIQKFKNSLLLDAEGLKSEVWMRQSEFEEDKTVLEEGTEVQVYLVKLDDGTGKTVLSREKARYLESLQVIEESYQSKSLIAARVDKKIKGGYSLSIGNIKSFLPGSLKSISKDLEEGQVIEVQVIKLSNNKTSIIASQKSLSELRTPQDRENFLNSVKEGDNIQGVIKNITNFGAFVDLGKIDGLIHIGDLSWERISHPSEVVQLGDKVSVKILSIKNQQVSLGLKHTKPNPWATVESKINIGRTYNGTVKSITNYGCFVEVAEGIEGLVHQAAVDWKKRYINIREYLTVGQKVDVKVIDLNPEKYKLSLSIKDCLPNPWLDFKSSKKKGDIIKCAIQSINTEIGIFVSTINEELPALIHLSDISWQESEIKSILASYNKGDIIDTYLINISVEENKQRVTLGLKQLNMDYFAQFTSRFKPGSDVTCKVMNIDDRFIVVSPDGHLESSLKTADVKSVYPTVTVGEEIRLRIDNIITDKKLILFRVPRISTKKKIKEEESLGGLIKEQLQNTMKEKE